MKCKRLSAWFLSLVMMFSLLPVSAAAVKWYDKHSVTVKYEFKDDSSKSKPDYVIKTIALSRCKNYSDVCYKTVEIANYS